MGLNLSLLAAKAGPRPEPDILGQARLNKPGGPELPGIRNARMRDPVKGLEQMLKENHRTGRSRGYIAVDGGVEKSDRDNGERRVGDHGLNKGQADGGQARRRNQKLEVERWSSMAERLSCGGEAGMEAE